MTAMAGDTIDASKLPRDPEWERKFREALTQTGEGPPKTGMRWLVDLKGEDGNAFVIMGVVRKAILKTLGKEEADLYGQRARSGDYLNLLATSREYVDIQHVPTGFLFSINDDEENDDDEE